MIAGNFARVINHVHLNKLQQRKVDFGIRREGEKCDTHIGIINRRVKIAKRPFVLIPRAVNSRNYTGSDGFIVSPRGKLLLAGLYASDWTSHSVKLSLFIGKILRTISKQSLCVLNEWWISQIKLFVFGCTLGDGLYDGIGGNW